MERCITDHIYPYTTNQQSRPRPSIAFATHISSNEWVYATCSFVRRRLAGRASVSPWLYWLISDIVVISITLWYAWLVFCLLRERVSTIFLRCCFLWNGNPTATSEFKY